MFNFGSHKTQRDDDDEEGDQRPSKAVRSNGGGSDAGTSSRRALLKAHVEGLNTQFASWVSGQAEGSPGELWTEGVKDYLTHVEGLLRDFSDVLPASAAAAAQSPAFGSSLATPEPIKLSKPVVPAFGAGGRQPTGGGGGGGGGGGRQAAPAPVFGGFGGGVFGAASASAGDELGAEKQAAPTPPFTFGGSDASKASPAVTTPTFGFLGGGGGGDSGSAASAAASTAAAAASAPATSSAFSFGSAIPPVAAGAATAESAPAAATTKSLFAFDSQSLAKTTPPSTMFSFGGASTGASTAPSTAAAPPMFSFGGAASTVGAFGSASTAAPFAFGGPAPAATASAPGGGGEGEGGEGEEEQPQKFESEVAVSEESGTIAFKAKAKFQHLAKSSEGGASSWESKGVGTLMLRTRNDGSAKPFVTFTTEAGRVLFIANIPKAMQCILIEARNSVSFSVPWSPDGQAPPTSQGVMFALPKGKHVDFKAALDKLQLAM